MKMKMNALLVASTLCCSLGVQSAYAAIALDRTRVIFDGSEKSVSLNVSNENKQLPYLAQGWIEDEKGNKITSPLTVLPPVQRIEPGAKSQVKVQGLPALSTLPQDRESLFYFNLREIPPRSEKPNTLQIALQTRIKLFYRPQAIQPTASASPAQEALTLSKVGNKYKLINPTPYFVTIVDGSNSPKGLPLKGFEPLMLAPKSEGMLNLNAEALGSNPVLTYINDYGGRPQLQFTCAGSTCQAKSLKNG